MEGNRRPTHEDVELAASQVIEDAQPLEGLDARVQRERGDAVRSQKGRERLGRRLRDAGDERALALGDSPLDLREQVVFVATQRADVDDLYLRVGDASRTDNEL